jgi:hypothetical protein
VKTKLFIALLSLFCSRLFAQESTTASGGDASGNGGSAAFSIGQPFYTVNAGSSGAVEQGIQNPYVISVATEIKEAGLDLSLSAFPNPTMDLLTLKVATLDADFSYQLFDTGGKLLGSEKITGNSTAISMGLYPTAIYFLKIIHTNKDIKTFQIIKN